jgi:hypothetical protein
VNQALDRGMPPPDPTGPPFSSFERWPPWLFYFPVALYWIWLAVKHGSPTLPTLVNPALEAGGLCGESKIASLLQLGPEGRRRLAPFTSITTLPQKGSRQNLEQALTAMTELGIDFPVVAKPEIACKGTGVCVIRTVAGLEDYLVKFPRGERLIFQKLVPHEGEAGVFYVRKPGEVSGRIVSLTLKYFPAVVGDGRSTLEELIHADRRAGRIAGIYLRRHSEHRRRVLAEGEVFKLVFTGNHCKGAIFRNGNRFVTKAMEVSFDAIAREIPEFYFGRFDVRFSSLSGLQRGEDFTIIEFNGAGSEATHIWDRGTTLAEAYRTLVRHADILFEIAGTNRLRGFAPMAVRRLIGIWLKQQRLMRAYPRGE